VDLEVWFHPQIQPQVSRPGRTSADLLTQLVRPPSRQTGYSLRYQLSTGNPRLPAKVLGHHGALTLGHVVNFQPLIVSPQL
jgi:hypothetical protein